MVVTCTTLLLAGSSMVASHGNRGRSVGGPPRKLRRSRRPRGIIQVFQYRDGLQCASSPSGPMVARWERRFQQLPGALVHAALSMAANSALKPEAPRIFTFGSVKPYDVTPTTALRVRLRTPVG